MIATPPPLARAYCMIQFIENCYCHHHHLFHRGGGGGGADGDGGGDFARLFFRLLEQRITQKNAALVWAP